MTMTMANTAWSLDTVWHLLSNSTEGREDSSFTRSSCAADAAANASNNNLKKKVSFSNICVREYNVTLGDNPSVSSGAPLTLGWNFCEHKPIRLDDNDLARKRRKAKCPRTLSYYERRYLLFWFGVPAKDQERAERVAGQIRRQRARSAALFGLIPFESAIESGLRKAKRLWLITRHPSSWIQARGTVAHPL